MNRIKRHALLILATAALLSCTQQRARYVVGVSQCSDDIWREKQNSELRMGAYLTDDVELRFAAAYDSDERQVEQIDSLVATGIDLLIVAPNQVATISPAIDRAYDKGLPVIVFERKTNSHKYTAFISADNYEMGRTMGEYMAQRLNHRGRVMEVMGLKGSSPAIERHKGFADALARYPDIELVATLQGNWTEESAYEAVKNHRGDLGRLDFVFGQNDRMAIGARRALAELQAQRSPGEELATRFCGIDGLPGENGGIQLVRDSTLDATYIYPTHGDQLLALAVDILEGKPYEKETAMMSALVTRDNASVLLMQGEEIARQSGYLDRLHERADNYLQELDTQRTITVLAFGLVVLLLMVIVLLYLYHQGKITLRRQRVVSNLWNLEEPAAQEPQQEPQPAESEGVGESEGGNESVAASLFIARFREVVEARLSDSELSVEDLAADMNLSRAQLYRKVKSITNASPVELLRTARLNRGYQLLVSTGKNISEVAYEVGFSSPSYFTKCFKGEFGVSPSDLQ